MNKEQLKKLFDLTTELAPENLHEDGEISIRQARQKEIKFLKQWKQLEKEIGRKVTQEEVIQAYLHIS